MTSPGRNHFQQMDMDMDGTGSNIYRVKRRNITCLCARMKCYGLMLFKDAELPQIDTNRTQSPPCQSEVEITFSIEMTHESSLTILVVVGAVNTVPCIQRILYHSKPNVEPTFV